MTFTKNSDEARKRLIEESGGSFFIVNKALNELRAENNTRRLDIEDVVKRIHKLREPEKITA